MRPNKLLPVRIAFVLILHRDFFVGICNVKSMDVIDICR